jgi:uncharacterized RDD family membrane protein YckC
VTGPTDGLQPLGGRTPEGIEQTARGARQIVRSPEQVELHLPVAGPASRILAYAIDYVLILLLLGAVLVAFAVFFVASGLVAEWLQEPLSELLGSMDPDDPESILGSAVLLLFVLVFLVLQLGAEWGYFVFSEMVSGGRSLGKKAVGLRVVRDGGRPITFRASAIRNLLRIADMLPTSYLVGLISIVVSPEAKRLGDIAAGTLVVRLDRPAPAAPIRGATGPAAAEFRFDRSEIARLGRSERTLLRQTLRRLEQLEPEQAEQVLSRVSEALCARLERAVPARDERLGFLEALWQASRRR